MNLTHTKFSVSRTGSKLIKEDSRKNPSSIFAAFTLCFFLSSAFSAASVTPVLANNPAKTTGIKWCQDMTSSMKKAAGDKKLIFLLFSAPGRCGASRYLEERVLPVGRVSDWLGSSYVCCRCNPDAGYGQKLRAVYPQGHGVPTIIIVSPEGRAIGWMSGYNGNPGNFMNQVANISRGLRPGFGTP